MKTIWKYHLNNGKYEYIQMPKGARILAFQLQHGEFCIWALVDLNAQESEQRTFRIFGTGDHIINPDGYTYIGTVQRSEFVWHLMEKL